MNQLFQTDRIDEPVAAGEHHVVGVAVNANVWGSFDYIWPDAFGEPSLGQRVRVPFGRGDKVHLGFVVDLLRRGSGRKLKRVVELIDRESQFDQTLWELGQWIGQYYLTPPGMTLAAMVPSAVGRARPRTESVVFGTEDRPNWPSSLGARQKRVLDELFEAKRQGVEPVTLEALLKHSGASRDSIKRLGKRKLIRLETRPVHLGEADSPNSDDPFELNEDQASAVGEIVAGLDGGFGCTLLYGVTGSGKTEVYIRAIREVIAAGRQAILLAPEIALATQTLARLAQRLPRVAMLHSGLTDAERAFGYQQIRDGHASVVIGPRSAIFAPTRKLGLIIVDEEHEPTYKQDTAPRYHGRDVAVKRAALEDVPIVLGSATPSLESLHNAYEGRYSVLRLPNRVGGLPMPRLQIVNLRKEVHAKRIELIGATLTMKMAAALDRSQQIILLMNRRGYASYVFCPSCKWKFSCDSCTRLLVFHQATQLAMCHYCQHTAALPEQCPACGGKLVYFGYGIQRIENELARKFPAARVARMDSDTMTSPKQFDKVLTGFRDGELDILLGTQMVAKGLDFPRVSLVGVISADTSLAIPDFRAAERTFQLIEHVSGRAGRSPGEGFTGEVVVQTLFEDEPAIQFAMEHDCDGFSEYELPLRRKTNLPPFSRLIRFVVRHATPDKAEQGAASLAETLRATLGDGAVTMYGPQPAAVKKIRDQFRFEIIVVCRKGGQVQHALAGQMASLCKSLPGELIVDVDPMNLI